MESEVECTLSKFPTATKPCGVVSMLEERDAIQKDLDRLERCAHENQVQQGPVQGSAPGRATIPGTDRGWAENGLRANPEEKVVDCVC